MLVSPMIEGPGSKRVIINILIVSAFGNCEIKAFKVNLYFILVLFKCEIYYKLEKS